MENIFRNKEVNDSFNQWLNNAPFSEQNLDRRRRYDFYVELLKYKEAFSEEMMFSVLNGIGDTYDAIVMAKQMVTEFQFIDDFYNLCELNNPIKK